MGSSIKTVKLKICKANKNKEDFLYQTKQRTDQAMDFYMKVILENQYIIGDKNPNGLIEHLTHRTKTNCSPRYKDIELPSITKRSVMRSALGAVSSYLTRLLQWEEKAKKNTDKKGKPGLPTAGTMPTFYYSDYAFEMKDIKNQFIRLRVYNGERWTFVNYPVKYTGQFLEKYKEHENFTAFEENKTACIDALMEKGLSKDDAAKVFNKTFGNNPYAEMCSPSLSLNKGIWYLCFPFRKTINMKKLDNYRKDKELTTLCVDLGINHLAVVTIKHQDELLKTEFISGQKINDLRSHALKKITQKQKLSSKPVKGESSNKALWDYVYNLNEDTAHQVSRRIVNLAVEYNADVIIFEHLKNFTCQKGMSKSKRMNLKRNYWLHEKIIEYTKYKAYDQKIYTCEVSAYYTSQICYKNNLSGERFSPASEYGKSIILFEDNSVLNADFNASMNLHRKFYRTFPSIIRKEHKLKQKELRSQIPSLIDKTLQQCKVA